jgi:hypothetical protein
MREQELLSSPGEPHHEQAADDPFKSARSLLCTPATISEAQDCHGEHYLDPRVRSTFAPSSQRASTDELVLEARAIERLVVQHKWKDASDRLRSARKAHGDSAFAELAVELNYQNKADRMVDPHVPRLDIVVHSHSDPNEPSKDILDEVRSINAGSSMWQTVFPESQQELFFKESPLQNGERDLSVPYNVLRRKLGKSYGYDHPLE